MATVPAAPTIFSISAFTNTTVTGDADLGSTDGGAAVVQWQLGYGTDSSTPNLFMDLSSTGSATVTGLTPGATYYFWSRQRNSVGWSAWSPRNSVTTRVTVPATPGAFYISSYTDTTATGDADPGSNGGSTVVQWQLGYGTGDAYPDYFQDLNLSGTGTVTGLSRGTLYYFWSRQRNSIGWSAWSPRTMQRTRNVPAAPMHPILTRVTQTSLEATVVPNTDGDSPITGYKLGFNSTSTLPPTTILTQNFGGASATFFVGQTSPELSPLQPGIKYYFWAKAINAIGESPWSEVYSVRMVAGAFVKVGLEWRSAVPYVKVNGIWRMARPWSRVAGTWKESSAAEDTPYSSTPGDVINPPGG